MECKDFQPQLTVSGRDLKRVRGLILEWKEPGGERVWEDLSRETVDKKQGGSGGRRETSGVAFLWGREEATLKPQVCLLGRDTGLTLTQGGPLGLLEWSERS